MPERALVQPVQHVLPREADSAVCLDGALAGGDRGLGRLRFRRGSGDGSVGLAVGDAPRRPPGERASRARAPSNDVASGCATAWYVPTMRPNCSRVLAYSTASSSARAPAPTGLEGEDRERPRAQLREHVRRAERAPGLASRDDAERARLVVRREELPLEALELPDRVAPDDSDVGRGVEVGDERAERERPARLARGDRCLVVAGEARQQARRSTRAARGGARVPPPRGAPPPRGTPSPAPPCSSETETPVQPSSASCAQVGSGVASRNERAWPRSSSWTG